MPILINIEVTPDIASKIRFLAEQGVFSMMDGSAELHFKNGQLLTVMTKRMGYAPKEFDRKEIGPILKVSA